MSSGLGACFVCRSTDGGPLSHICAVCKAEVCPSCVSCKELSACPACGDTHQDWKTLQKLGSVFAAYGTARDWFRGVAPNTSGAVAAPTTNWVSTPSPIMSNANRKEELPSGVVGEVVDWLRDEISDDKLLEDGVTENQIFKAPETLELEDAGKKCTSVIGANGDYRSGMAREAVAYLLKNSMAASKAKGKKTLPQGNSNNSTAAPSTDISPCPTQRFSAFPTQRSEKPEVSACPTQRSEKSEDPPESFHTALPSDAEPSEHTWRTALPSEPTLTPTSHSQTQSPRQGNDSTHCSTTEKFEVDTTNDAAAQGWGFEAFAKGLGGLMLPTVPTWSATVSHCTKMDLGNREVMEHGHLSEPSPAPPAMLDMPVDESPSDDWAEDHFAALENVASSRKAGSVTGIRAASAATDDDCRSYVTSIICPPVVPPLVFPTSGGKDHRTPARPSESPRTASNFEAKGDCDKTMCVGISNDEDVCPKGHDLRWHAWSCTTCNKRGSGLRFGCVECLDANLCLGCKKSHDAQKQGSRITSCTSSSSVVHAETQPAHNANEQQELMHPSKALDVITENYDASKSSPMDQPLTKTYDVCEDGHQSKPKNSDRSARSSSSSRRERTGPSASKSVLSVQTMGTSSAAQLLGDAAKQQQGKKPTRGSASKSVLSVQTMGTSAAAELLGGFAQQQQGSKPRSSSSKKAFESKSVVGAAGSTRPAQRTGGSVLSVKNTSSSAAAGLLGPLLEQKAQR